MKRRIHKSAEHAKRSRELEASWIKLLASHTTSFSIGISSSKVKQVSPVRRASPAIPSLNTHNGDASLRQSPVYTGSKILGIGGLHKSNAVPVFSKSDAIDIAKMRR